MLDENFLLDKYETVLNRKLSEGYSREYSQVYAQNYVIGYKEGYYKEYIRILKQVPMSDEEISKATGLSVDEINKL